MDTNITLIFILSSAVTFLALTLSAVYFWNNYKLGLEQRLLGVVMLCLSYMFVLQHFNINFSIYFLPHLFRTGPLAGIAAISLLYVLIEKQITKSPWQKSNMWHSLPLLFYIFNFLPFFVQSTTKKQELLKQLKNLDDFYLYNEGLLNENIIYLFFALLVLCYLLFAFKLYFTHKKQFNNKAACMVMLKRYLLVLSIIFLVVVLYYFDFFILKNSFYVNVAYYGASLIFIFYLFYDYKFFFKQFFSEEFKKNEYQLLNQKLNSATLSSVSESHQKEQNCLAVLNKLETYLKESKSYLNFNFSLKNLEHGAGISSNKISNCIKKIYKVNFNQYINVWRIQYLLDELKRDKIIRSFNIEALGTKIGFKNSSSFYNSFKSYTGLSPREFIDDLIENEQMDA